MCILGREKAISALTVVTADLLTSLLFFVLVDNAGSTGITRHLIHLPLVGTEKHALFPLLHFARNQINSIPASRWLDVADHEARLDAREA